MGYGNTIRGTGGTTTRQQIMDRARAYLGTPYRHHGRKLGEACDCIGLVAMVGKDLGVMDGDFFGYSPTPIGMRSITETDNSLIRIWDRSSNLQPVATDALQPGLVGLFWYANRNEPQHLAILGQHPLDPELRTIIHAHSEVNKVVEATLEAFWLKRLVRIYRLPGTLD